MNDTCQNIRSLLSRLMDDLLEPAEANQVKEHLQTCSDCQNEFEAEKQIAQLLTELPDQACPENVIKRIELATGIAQGSNPSPKRSRIHLPFWKPLYAGLALTTVIILILLKPFVPSEPSMPVPVTQEEVLIARKQAKWSLSLVAGLIHKTQNKVLEDVLMKELPKTFRKTIRNTFPIVKGGQK